MKNFKRYWGGRNHPVFPMNYAPVFSLTKSKKNQNKEIFGDLLELVCTGGHLLLVHRNKMAIAAENSTLRCRFKSS